MEIIKAILSGLFVISVVLFYGTLLTIIFKPNKK
jgi:hypothetical protein